MLKDDFLRLDAFNADNDVRRSSGALSEVSVC